MISNKSNTERDFWGVIVIFCQFLVRGSGSGILLYKANLNLVAQSTEILFHRASNPADPLSVLAAQVSCKSYSSVQGLEPGRSQVSC